jgi:hypothetical protein
VQTDSDTVGWSASHRETAIACIYSNERLGRDRMTDAGLWAIWGDHDWLAQPIHGGDESP